MNRNSYTEECPTYPTMATLVDTSLESPYKKASGKGLVWNWPEQLALARSSTVACTDPAVGAQISMAQLGRKLRFSFIIDEDRPLRSCTTYKDCGYIDHRRWDGRSADACLNMWQRLRKECTKFKTILSRISSLQFKAALLRCASL